MGEAIDNLNVLLYAGTDKCDVLREYRNQIAGGTTPDEVNIPLKTEGIDDGNFYPIVKDNNYITPSRYTVALNQYLRTLYDASNQQDFLSGLDAVVDNNHLDEAVNCEHIDCVVETLVKTIENMNKFKSEIGGAIGSALKGAVSHVIPKGMLSTLIKTHKESQENMKKYLDDLIDEKNLIKMNKLNIEEILERTGKKGDIDASFDSLVDIQMDLSSQIAAIGGTHDLRIAELGKDVVTGFKTTAADITDIKVDVEATDTKIRDIVSEEQEIKNLISELIKLTQQHAIEGLIYYKLMHVYMNNPDLVNKNMMELEDQLKKIDNLVEINKAETNKFIDTLKDH